VFFQLQPFTVRIQRLIEKVDLLLLACGLFGFIGRPSGRRSLRLRSFLLRIHQLHSLPIQHCAFRLDRLAFRRRFRRTGGSFALGDALLQIPKLGNPLLVRPPLRFDGWILDPRGRVNRLLPITSKSEDHGQQEKQMESFHIGDRRIVSFGAGGGMRKGKCFAPDRDRQLWTRLLLGESGFTQVRRAWCSKVRIDSIL
jgi:hypothetical protein